MVEQKAYVDLRLIGILSLHHIHKDERPLDLKFRSPR